MKWFKKYYTQEAEVLMAFKDAGLSNSEIAQRLGVSEGAKRYRLHKVREKTGAGRKLKPFAVSAF